MNTLRDIQDFVQQKTLAIAGLSRNERAFSASAFRELSARGYRLLPVNPNAETIFGLKCYPRVSALPEKVGGVLVFTKPSQTAGVVQDAVSAGVSRIWIQQGAESPEALELCRQPGLAAVSGRCILMFAEPVGALHGVHRWFLKLFGGLPK
jgi:uncharacterized protein